MQKTLMSDNIVSIQRNVVLQQIPLKLNSSVTQPIINIGRLHYMGFTVVYEVPVV